MLEGLLWTLLGVLGLMIAALAVPVELVARLDLGARSQVMLRIGWLYGLVRVRRQLGVREPAAAEPPKERRRGRRSGRPNAAVIQRGVGLVGDLLRRVRVRRAALDLTLGTGDPAATGQMVGYAAPLVAMANALPRTRVALRPDFSGPAFEGAGEGEIRLVPLALVPPLVGFALSPEVRRWLFSRRR